MSGGRLVGSAVLVHRSIAPALQHRYWHVPRLASLRPPSAAAMPSQAFFTHAHWNSVPEIGRSQDIVQKSVNSRRGFLLSVSVGQ